MTRCLVTDGLLRKPRSFDGEVGVVDPKGVTRPISTHVLDEREDQGGEGIG